MSFFSGSLFWNYLFSFLKFHNSNILRNTCQDAIAEIFQEVSKDELQEIIRKVFQDVLQ